MADISCPRCGQPNEKEREVCWACCQLISAEKRPASQESVSRPQPVSGGLGGLLDLLGWGSLGILSIVLGVFLIYRFYIPSRDAARALAAQSAQAEGTIVGVKRYHGRSNAVTHVMVKILFTAESGRQVTFDADLGRQEVGADSKLPVRYDPRLPKNCGLGQAGEASLATMNVLLFGCGFILAGVLLWLWKFPFLSTLWRR
ncbi:MAG: DUF3592 domain-containing protein [Elusimicrobia bacterium]|nr:DUF3592 domain-containing protein [Elusimicrobiota bacterium]